MSSKLEQVLSLASSRGILQSPDFIKTTHKKPYEALTPTRPELSQAGRTVLVTGGNSGIGYAAALAFGRAGASRVIITGRRPTATAEAASSLMSSSGTTTTEFVGTTCDMAKPDAIDSLWADLEGRDVAVDVLVLNAARISESEGILERGTDAVWGDYNVNLRAQLHMAERFYKQRTAPAAAGRPKVSKTREKPLSDRVSTIRFPLFLVMVSTAAIHEWAVNDPYPSYGLSKNAGTLAMQLIARETTPDDMQIVSYHPGAVFTDSARKVGVKEDSWDWIDANLPGQFAVWAASTQANFLHGRYVWSEWDINELKRLKERLEKDENFLRIGVHGF